MFRRMDIVCLVGDCLCMCTMCHSWQHAWVVHMFRRADSKYYFEEIPVFGYMPSIQPAMFAVVSFVLGLFLLAIVSTPGRPTRRLQHFLPPPCSRCFGYRISSFSRYSSDKFAYFVRIVIVATVVIRVVVKCIRICHQQNSVDKFSVYLHALVLPICQKKSKHIP